ncbi:hypothetical protein LTR33_010119 [Friedmanniomyces endolithicus]|nr:hypothetical protein LTR33_010119 [Friedmanniomyces endolithicus]
MPAEIRNEIYRACLTRPFTVLLSRREPPPPERKPEKAVDVVELSDTEEEGESFLVVANTGSGATSASATSAQSGGSQNPTPGLHSWANRTTRPVRLLNSSSSTQATVGTGTASSTRASTRSTQQHAQAAARAQLRNLAAAKPDPPRVPRPQDEDPLLVNLLRCSKTVYQEARSILYAENLFALDLDTALTTLAALHQRSRRQIKHVEVEIPCYNEILERFQETVRLSLRYCWGLKKLVIHMPFTLPGADGSGTTGNTTVYANGFDILRWLPRPCEVVLSGQICKEIEQVVSKNANLARTLDEPASEVELVKLAWICASRWRRWRAGAVDLGLSTSLKMIIPAGPAAATLRLWCIFRDTRPRPRAVQGNSGLHITYTITRTARLRTPAIDIERDGAYAWGVASARWNKGDWCMRSLSSDCYCEQHIERGREGTLGQHGFEWKGGWDVGKRVVDVSVLEMGDYECLYAAPGSIE